MIATGNGLERKKIIYILYNGFKKYVSVCNMNMYLSGDSYINNSLIG